MVGDASVLKSLGGAVIIKTMNRTILDQIRAADIRGASASEMKRLYLQLCAIDLKLKEPIHRIFQLNYLREDIENKRLTHVRVSPANWGDPYENPLLRREFTENTGTTVSLEELCSSLFGICWTGDSQESHDQWNAFSHGKLALRVSTTAEKLLAGVMNIENPFYMLSHFLGKVSYYAQRDIDQWLQDSDYQDFVDSLGQRFASAMLVLRECFEEEQEARLLYWYSPKRNDWVRQHVKIEGELCRVPFDWRGVMDVVTTAPGISNYEFAEIQRFFGKLNVKCVPRQIPY